MGIKKFRPVTSTTRFKTAFDFAEITTDKPYKPLTVIRKKTGGRNSNGRITTRHRGGGHKQRIRIIDFYRKRHGEEANVLTIEYDPIRTGRIALIEYKDGTKNYMLAPDKLKVGDKVMSGEMAEIKVGNHLPLKNIPSGTPVHNIELLSGQGAKLVRSAGGVAQILSKEEKTVNIKLPSGEVRMFPFNAYATVGQVSNIENEKLILGKAGRKRWLGVRPTVRGVAMNPVDHPLGGGEGRTSGGRHPCSPWGQKAKGLKTRKKNKMTNKYVVKDRRK